MAESDVFDEEKLFATFLQRGKAFGLQETDLMDYVDKQIRQAQERQDRLIVRREEEANRKQLESAAIKEREETARQTAKEETARQTAKEETARQTAKEQEETKRQAHAEEEETKRQAHAHSQASTQDGGDGPGQASRVGHRPTLPKLPAFRDKTDDIDSYLFRFETHATALKWDKTHWVTYLSALLEGTALTLFHSLSDTEDGTVTYDGTVTHGNQGKILVAFVISVIPLISVLFVRRLRRNLWRVHWHPLLFVLKLIVPCRNLFQASCIFSPGQ